MAWGVTVDPRGGGFIGEGSHPAAEGERGCPTTLTERRVELGSILLGWGAGRPHPGLPASTWAQGKRRPCPSASHQPRTVP